MFDAAEITSRDKSRQNFAYSTLLSEQYYILFVGYMKKQGITEISEKKKKKSERQQCRRLVLLYTGLERKQATIFV